MERRIGFDKGFGVVATILLLGLSIASGASAQVTGPYNVYTVPSCRVLDTRMSNPAGAVSANGTRNIRVRGDLTAGGTINQGGAPNCLIPAAATAVFINVIAVTASGAGYLTVYPFNKPLPQSSTLNFSAGQTVADGNLATLCTGTCTNDLSITMGATAGANLVVDVTGFVMP